MDIMDFLTGLAVAELSVETGLDVIALKNDFKKYNKAINDLIALGYDEDAAIKKVSETWDFEGLY